MEINNLSYEQAVSRLGEIVENLEKGNMPLSHSLSLFEEGTALIKYCSELLDKAEQKVVMLKKGPDGAPIELPFEVEA
ncbi:MAG: exodeoxyribonuclease VII small subunit [Oscillospiraceae bacterium]|nr:exodeoxyribonuclease VII small subunit [Oscillospiraceae bacterium]